MSAPPNYEAAKEQQKATKIKQQQIEEEAEIEDHQAPPEEYTTDGVCF